MKRGQQSVAAVAGDDPFRPRSFSNLSASLLRRYERDGALTDLDAAVDASGRAVDAAPDTDLGRPRYLGNLANVLMARFARTGAPDHLDRAVDASRRAVEASPDGDANRVSYLNSLANALQLRFRRTADDHDLIESIDASQQALAVVPPGQSLRGIVLGALSLGLIFRYSRTQAPSDLDNAVEAARQAVQAAGQGHKDRASFLSRKLLALWLRFGLTRAPEDLREGIQAGQEAAATEAAAPAIRVSAAVVWGNLAADADEWPEAVRAYRSALDLLGKVAPHGLARSDQEYQLIGISGVGSRAAACCLKLGETSPAVELLERGRGFLLQQALDMRADLTSLERVRPDLAARFTELRVRLDTAPWMRGSLAGGPHPPPSLAGGSTY